MKTANIEATDGEEKPHSGMGPGVAQRNIKTAIKVDIIWARARMHSQKRICGILFKSKPQPQRGVLCYVVEPRHLNPDYLY